MPLPQLVLIPGLASDTAMWRAQLDALPTTLRPVVVDVHTRHATIEAMAQASLDEHAGELLLCGASMDGMMAMQAARSGGERVRGLVLIGTSARPETAAMRQLRQTMLDSSAQGHRLAAPEQSREIAALVPGAELEMLAGCGHMPTMKVPGVVNAIMLA